MLIHQLTLENFGLFRGRNQLDLAPREKQGEPSPVVLIGGKNGAGKTTLMEAIRLCLYGPLALRSRTGNREYEKYLRESVHRNDRAVVAIRSASVGLEFEYAKSGRRDRYQVKRAWDLVEGGVRSRLAVSRNGEPLDELDHAHAEEFLRDLVPQGVSQLYFFDGEKIQQLAESDDDNASLADAVRGLLGLDLIERLRADLRICAARNAEGIAADPIEAELAALAKERRELEERRRAASREKDEAQSRHDRLMQDLAKRNQQIAREGGAFAKSRDALEVERDQLKKNLADAEANIRALCEDLLPFALARSLCQDLRGQLGAEERLQSWQGHQSLLRERLDEMRGTLDRDLASLDAAMSAGAREALKANLLAFLGRLLKEPDDLPKATVIHALAPQQRQRLLTAIERALTDIPVQVTASQKVLEAATRRLVEVEQALNKIPHRDEIQPLLDELGALQNEYAGAAADLANARAALAQADQAVATNSRREQALQEKLANVAGKLDRRAMVAKIQAALHDYTHTLTAAKVHALSHAVKNRFSELLRKHDILDRIEIDASNFQVLLFDRFGRPLSKQQLSAGEKQIYAISLLWALADISGRPLPMVIDTPLGRLDSDHRANLVERYLPRASHQVVILSTDTEIDRAYFQGLGPCVSHAYHLRYDAQEKCTVIEDGYFWAKRDKELVHAT